MSRFVVSPSFLLVAPFYCECYFHTLIARLSKSVSLSSVAPRFQGCPLTTDRSHCTLFLSVVPLGHFDDRGVTRDCTIKKAAASMCLPTKHGILLQELCTYLPSPHQVPRETGERSTSAALASWLGQDAVAPAARHQSHTFSVPPQ
jgi:hypothetical protein